MQVNGMVLKVRESSFADKKTGQPIENLYFDLYDDSAGVIPCEMRKNGVVLVERSEIRAVIGRVKKTVFGVGYSFVVQELFLSSPNVLPPSVPRPPEPAKK